jgi:hypothetical protein
MIKIDEIDLELLTIVQPEDRVLFRVDQKLSVGQFSVLREQITNALGTIKFLIICPGIEAHLLRQLNRDDPGDMNVKRDRATEGSARSHGRAGEGDQDGATSSDESQDRHGGES